MTKIYSSMCIWPVSPANIMSSQGTRGPLETGHDKAVIRTPNGKEQSHAVRPVARSKVGSIPVGADVLFLIDESDVIVDATFGSKEAVQRSEHLSQKMSPIKGNLAQISGVIQQPLENNRIVIKTENGKGESYEVRPLIQERLGTWVKGDAAMLLVDEESGLDDLVFNGHARRHRTAAALAKMRRLRLAGPLHSARFERWPALEPFQPCNLRTLGRYRLLQGRHLAQRPDDKRLQFRSGRVRRGHPVELMPPENQRQACQGSENHTAATRFAAVT